MKNQYSRCIALTFKIFALICLLGFLNSSFAQYSTIKQKDPGTIFLKTYKNTLKTKGYLYQLADSAIVMSNNKNLPIEIDQLKEFRIPHVQYVQYKKKGATKKGAIIGACTGILTGIVIGAVSGDHYGSSGSTMGLLLGVAMAVPSSIVGALIGSSIKVKIPINGSYSKYNENKKLLDPFLLE